MDFKEILRKIFAMLDVYDRAKFKDTSFEKKQDSFIIVVKQSTYLSKHSH
jgi:hypothetical protein